MNNVCRDVVKRNYELEAAKYVLQGKKVRENPLADLESRGGDDMAAPGGNGFGSQQQFQLGKAKAVAAGIDDDEDADVDAKK